MNKYLILLLAAGFFFVDATAQQTFKDQDFTHLEWRLNSSVMNGESTETEEFPEPKSVMYKSMMLPGWGQIVNKQAWKVPVIYGLFAGLGYYTYDVTQQYHDYRAAYYNQSRGEDTDYKFGETPDYIPDNISLAQLRDTRNNLRNRRDLMYVVMVLAYGLNVVDAYVYAHMRSFDVSDDLSANIEPGMIFGQSPGIRVRVNF